MNKYSVLMSVYTKDNSGFFVSAVESMIHQTVIPDEIVLVEDGPLTEELLNAVDTLVQQNPGLFHILINVRNLGLGPSLNRGVLACRNELIARMDSDDLSVSTRIEKQLKAFEEEPDLSICGGAIAEFSENPNVITGYRQCPSTNEQLRDYIRKRCPFNHMSVMYKRSKVLEAGNYQDYLFNEDYLLWIRMMEHGMKMRNLPEVLVQVRAGDEMFSRRGGNAYYESEKGIQKTMLHDGLIDQHTYYLNMIKRFLAEKACPNGLRKWLFKLFARSRTLEESHD